MKHLGNLTVTPENALSFPAVSEIYGHLTITAGARLIAPNLTMVRGWVTILDNGSFGAPQLGLVDGWLTIRGEGAAWLPNLTEVRADLTMDVDGNLDAPLLDSVGALQVRNGSQDGWPFPSLRFVRNALTLGAGNVSLSMPLLDTVGGSLTLRANAELNARVIENAPNLRHIGGYADIDETATIVAPKFTNAT